MPYKDPIKAKEAAKIRMQRWREKHKDDPIAKANTKKWNKITWQRHGEKYNEKHMDKYHNTPGVKESYAERMKKYREDNKSELNEKKKQYNKIRRKTDTQFLVKSRLRCLIYNSVKLYGQGSPVLKSRKYGLNLKEIAEYLEKSKPKDFNEQLYHIDHIIPVASFDLTNPEEVKKAFDKNNLQWLPALENIKKSNKLTNY